jgi:hypothetical protein
MRLFPTKDHADATAIGRQLVACLRDEPANLAPRLAALTPSAADALVTQANAHSVAPLLRRGLLQQGLFAALPEPARARLDAIDVDSTARAMARYRELDRLSDRFAAAAIPFIALKGIYLAKAVYAEPGLRPMADMDLLFRVEDLEQAQAVLVALGYSRAEPDRPVADYTAVGHQLPAFNQGALLRVEVHLRLERANAPFAIDLDGLWQRARSWSVNGRTLLALSTEDLLLHLCLHAMYHHRFRIGLIALVDLREVIRREPLDWDRFVAQARAWRAEIPAYLGLALASGLVGAAVPAPVLAALAPAADGEEALRLAARTLLAARSEDRRADPLRDKFFYPRRMAALRALPGTAARIGFLLTRVFPTRASLELRYPDWACSRWNRLLYLVHWAKLGARMLRATRLGEWRQNAVMRKLDRRWFS